MQNISDFNDIQARIVRELFTREALRFAELNTLHVPSDQFSYHLRQLQKLHIIQKDSDNRYELTPEGKTKAILLDKDSDKFIRQGFVALRVVVTRTVDGRTEHLMQQRTKVPFRGYYAEPGGKILFGENVLDAAHRNFEYETGLTADFEICGLVHYKDIYQDIIMQDKFFFVIKASNVKGKLKSEGSTGKNLWIEQDELLSHPKAHAGINNIIKIAEKSQSFNFAEETFVTEEY